jgi:hypothetical protein
MSFVKYFWVLDGMEVTVLLQAHALERTEQRWVDPYEVIGILDRAGESLFAGKMDESIVIRDYDKNLSLAYSAESIEGELELTIRTVFGSARGLLRGTNQRAICILNDTPTDILDPEQAKEFENNMMV